MSHWLQSFSETAWSFGPGDDFYPYVKYSGLDSSQHKTNEFFFEFFLFMQRPALPKSSGTVRYGSLKPEVALLSVLVSLIWRQGKCDNNKIDIGKYKSCYQENRIVYFQKLATEEIPGQYSSTKDKIKSFG